MPVSAPQINQVVRDFGPSLLPPEMQRSAPIRGNDRRGHRLVSVDDNHPMQSATSLAIWGDMPELPPPLASPSPTPPEDYRLAEPLLDANEAAALLHVPRSTVYELVRSRGLPHVRIGARGLRFTRAGLETWVERNTFSARNR
jgi:excisionase family DNA binding protein